MGEQKILLKECAGCTFFFKIRKAKIKKIETMKIRKGHENGKYNLYL